MPLAPGAHLGPYEISGPLGAGGMGEVYRARDTRLDRTVAIKILSKEMSDDPAHKQRFEREAKTIFSLNHPHICTLHDIGCHKAVSLKTTPQPNPQEALPPISQFQSLATQNGLRK